MTLEVYRGRKTTMQQPLHIWSTGVLSRFYHNVVAFKEFFHNFLLFAERTLNSMSFREDSFHDDGPGVVNPYAPVQGQRRVGVEKSKKSRKQNNSGPQSPSPKQKGSCKQQ